MSVSSKSDIRKQFLKKREKLTRQQVQSLSTKITSNLLDIAEIKGKHNFLIYLALPKEVQTKEIIKDLLKKSVAIFVPNYAFAQTLRPGHCKVSPRQRPGLLPSNTKGGDYIITRFTNWQNLEEGLYKILQPKNPSPVRPETIDIAIIPGVAFDLNGTRIGFGKGTFDKLLANSKALKIGLAYDFQMLEKPIIKEAHDITVDIIITEKRIHRPTLS